MNNMQDIQKYQSYTVEKLLEDEHFQDWVHHPSTHNTTFWTNVIKAYPEQEKSIAEARLVLEAVGDFFTPKEEINITHDSFITQMKETMHRGKIKENPKVKRRSMIRNLSIAASVALIATVMLWNWSDASLHSEKVYTTVENDFKLVELPDHSIVKLNKNSVLKTAASWKDNETRQVWLQGEAFFQVEDKSSEQIKFEVITDDLVVEVYGTSFNVNTNDFQTEVFLEEGSIQLKMEDKQEQLKPGDFVKYSKTNKVITKHTRIIEKPKLDWKNEVLSYKEQSVAEILMKIEKVYDIKIQLNKSEIKEQIRTIRIPKEKLDVAIPILERSLNVSIKQEGHLLILS